MQKRGVLAEANSGCGYGDGNDGGGQECKSVGCWQRRTHRADCVVLRQRLSAGSKVALNERLLHREEHEERHHQDERWGTSRRGVVGKLKNVGALHASENTQTATEIANSRCPAIIVPPRKKGAKQHARVSP